MLWQVDQELRGNENSEEGDLGLTFGPGNEHLNVKCEYITNQKSNVMKYTTFCSGIN